MVLSLFISSSLIGETGSNVESRKNSDDQWLVGAYYYPWYSAPRSEGSIGWMSKALRGRLSPKQLPELGVYSSRDPEVIGRHIEHSVHAGIDFWAVSWWGPGRREDETLRENIFTHPSAGDLKYAALYESTGRLGSFENPDYSNLIPDFEYMKENLFQSPHYLRVDGKPVVFIYLTRVYFRNRGEDALSALRAKFPDLYLIGDEVFGAGYRAKYAEKWDAITAYDVYGQSFQLDGATRKGIRRLKENYTRARLAAHQAEVDFIPAIAPGYNDRAVRNGHAGRPRYFTDEPESVEGDVFRTLIREVAFDLSDEGTGNMWMITSFNEWYEDTQIEPTQGTQPTTQQDDSESEIYFTEKDRYYDYGTLYLDILNQELNPLNP